jgi:adenine phosphoribosyltransferase
VPDLIAAGLIRDIPDFPKPGIMFKDITPVLSSYEALSQVVELLSESARLLKPDIVVGIESRGFLLGVPVALNLGVGFVPVRKLGKLPYKTIFEEYALEYGTNTVEIHSDSILPGQRVLIIDDLLATGGTAAAAARLVEKIGGEVAGLQFLVELAFLPGRLPLAKYEVEALIRYD